MSKKRVLWLTLAVLLLGTAAALWAWSHRTRSLDTSKLSATAVKRGDMLVSVIEGGAINAVSDVTVNCEVRGQSRIVRLVSEGRIVKKGDVLVELDTSQLDDRLAQAQLAGEAALAANSQAETELQIVTSQNASNIRDAEFNLDYARNDLQKFRDGQIPQDIKKAEANIAISSAELLRNRDRLQWTEKLVELGYASRSELEADRLAVKRSELELEQMNEALRITRTYDHPVQLKKLESQVLKAKDELERVKSRAEADVFRVQSNLASKKNSLDLNRQQLADLRAQLAFCRVVAPQDGMVVYASSVERRWGANSIEEGATVNQHQPLIKLPDTSAMKVETKIHEARMNQIREGMQAFISIDAIPDHRFKGHVAKVGLMPDQSNRWMNPDLKVYAVDVSIDDPLPGGIKPGLSAKSEIVVAKLEAVLQVPLQCVVTIKRRQYCYRREGAGFVPAEIKLGLYNDSMVEIVSGLRENDSVLLEPPTSDETLEMEQTVVPLGEVPASTAAEIGVAREAASSPFREKAPQPGKDQALISGKANDTPAAGAAEDKGAGGAQRETGKKRWSAMTEAERKSASDKEPRRRND